MHANTHPRLRLAGWLICLGQRNAMQPKKLAMGASVSLAQGQKQVGIVGTATLAGGLL
jgi:hypothetical protein